MKEDNSLKKIKADNHFCVMERFPSDLTHSLLIYSSI